MAGNISGVNPFGVGPSGNGDKTEKSGLSFMDKMKGLSIFEKNEKTELLKNSLSNRNSIFE